MRTATPFAARFEYYVIFSSRQKASSLADILTNPAFRHVSAVKADARTGYWTWIDVGAANVVIETWLFGPVDDSLAVELFENDAILRVLPGKGPVFGSRLGKTCVTAVKHMISSPSRALRPQGLWRYLVAAGAVIVKEPNAAENPRLDRL